jgi:hypothetical protein
MPDFHAIVIRGPLTEDDLRLLAATIREIDDRHDGVDAFEVVAVDPTDTSLEIAEALLKRAVPEVPGRVTTYQSWRK